MAEHPSIRIHNLQAGYGGRSVLQVEELAYGPGLHLVLGPNGAGKTTLFRVTIGILPPFKGQIWILGKNPYQNPEVKAKIGYLPHRPGFAPGVTLKDELAFWGRVYGLNPTRYRQRLEILTELLGLEALLPLRAERLSRGQAQLAALARALLDDPPVLVLDEPTTGLDPKVARRVRELVRDLAQNRVILYSTHNLYEAKELAKDVTFLRKGRVLMRAPLEEALRSRTQPRRVFLRVLEEARSAGEALRSHGLSVEEAEGGLILTVPEETLVGSAISVLSSLGFRVVEVREVDNPLEQLFLELSEVEG